MLQIAAHVDEVPPAELYAACAAAREIMPASTPSAASSRGRSAATPGAFERTDGPQGPRARRRPARSYLEELQAAGVPVHTVGKVGQVFDGVGVDDAAHGRDQRRRRSTRPRS